MVIHTSIRWPVRNGQPLFLQALFLDAIQDEELLRLLRGEETLRFHAV